MANLAKWGSAEAWASPITTNLNSLVTGSSTGLSGNVANNTDLYQYVDASLVLGSINPSGSPYLELHLCALTGDGTNYADVTAGTQIGTFRVTTGSTAKYAFINGLWIPFHDYKWAIVNQTGVTLASSGNTFYTSRAYINLNG